MRYFVGLLLVILVLAGMVTAVFAHDAAIVKSIPANGEVLAESPPKVTAWFEEELVSSESTLSVFDTTGTQVDNGDGGVDLNDPDHASMIVTLPPLPDGAYTVQWRAALLDGDATNGAFSFAVGEGQTAAPVVAPTAAPAAEEGSSQPSFGILAVAIIGLFIVLLIGGLAIRRRQA